MFNKPLAFRVRPTCIDEIIGQKHLVGEDGILKKSCDEKTIFSIIFYGEPGNGKTTIAECYAKTLGVKYFKFNAVINNKQDLDVIFNESKLYNPCFIIIDEVHRLNKDKQDLLLPYLEDGSLYLLGTTTSNPFFSINKAIRSRTQLLEVPSLTKDDIKEGIKRAIAHKNGLNNSVSLTKDAIDYIANVTNGDLRYALNYLEIISFYHKKQNITVDEVKSITHVPNFLNDQNGDGHYDSVSALQKSIRGSDVDASLYYLARLCVVGDIESISRRLLVISYEDVGLGNPACVNRVFTAIESAKQVGFPEAMIPLGFAVCDLALSPKSRAAADSIEKAVSYVKSHPLDVLDYLKYTPTNLNEEEKYPYDRQDLWEKIQYLPNLIKNMKFYLPNENPSNYEKALNLNYSRLLKISRSSDLTKLKKKK